MNDQIEQRSEQWFAERAGKITGSRFLDVLKVSKKDGKPLAGRSTYMRQLAFERLADTHKHSVSSKSLAWGAEIEDAAIETYELFTGNIVDKAPFIIHPTYEFIGASADGLIDDDGGIECKCPMDEAVHINTWLEGMPEDHMPQVQGAMFVTDRQWWDFLSFDPRQSEKFRLYIQRIPRDQEYINRMEKSLLQFEMELRAMVELLNQKVAA